MRKVLMATIVVVLTASASVGIAAQPEEDAASRAPVPSSGCGISEVTPGFHREPSLDVDGVERQWVLFVPGAHDGTTPMPLWLQFHGYGGDGASEVSVHKGAADEHGFVLAAPEAELGVAGWAWQEEDLAADLSRTNPDVAFTHALLDRIGERLCVDLARVYAAGYSFGGEGVSVLGCALEDRIAAVAPVAGMLDLGDTCVLDRPVPLIAVHGRADDLALFEGGWGGQLAWANDPPLRQASAQGSIPQRVANVAQRNGCEPEATIETLGEDAERWTWTCPDDADVELIAHGGGHGWPANEPVATTKRIWEFFEKHPMPE